MGRTPEEIKKGLGHCSIEGADCTGCVYRDECMEEYDNAPIQRDALAYIQHLEMREWDLFDLITSAWFGKRCYFQQDDGTVYSRASGEYMSFDQAIDEFAHDLTCDRECAQAGKDTHVPRWISVEDRLPKRNEVVVVTDGKHTWDYGEFNGLAFCFSNDNPNPRQWNWKKHTVKDVEWWTPKKTALPKPPKED